MEEAKEELTKTEEEVRQELLGAVNPTDQLDFEKELETVFDVGEHKQFFIRQIENCKIKMDLAVVGIGIIRVHQVLRGENPSTLDTWLLSLLDSSSCLAVLDSSLALSS